VPSSAVRLIDCILYNGEPVAALRLAAVYPHVDEIVVVEARQTFTGLRKPALCIEANISVFAPFVDKLTFVVVEFPPDVLAQGAWACETYQRNAPAERIRARWAGQPYVVMVCDVDEVPSAPVLAGLRGIHPQLDAPVYLVMHLLFYNFDWCKVEPWARAFVVNERCALTFEQCRTGYRRDRFLQNAGHHLSYFMGVDEMRRKLDSFSHTEVNTPQVNNAEWLRGCIERGIDIVGRERSKDRKRLVPTPPAVRASVPPGWESLQAQLLLAAAAALPSQSPSPSPSPPPSATPGTAGGVWLGYLTWRRRQVFARTLASHDRAGLLACIPPAHRVVFCQEATEADRVLAAEYQCSVLDRGSPTNVGILAAFVRILASVPPECPYLLFCEDDWAACECDGGGGVEGVLADAVGLLADGHADVVRLRSRLAPGEPLYSQREWGRIAASPEQRQAFPYKLESLCWLADGQALAAAYQSNSESEVLRHVAGARTGRPWYVTTTEHQRWSNNVFLARVDAMRARVLPVLRARADDGVGAKLYGGLEDVLVAELGGACAAGHLRIAAGDGIFTHSDRPDLPPRGDDGGEITYHDFWSSFYTGEETAVDRWRAYLEAMVRPIMRAKGRSRAEIWSVFGPGPSPGSSALGADVLRVQYSGESFFHLPERFDVNFVPAAAAASPRTISSTQAATYLSVHRLWAQAGRARAFPREMDWATRRFAVMVASNPRATERTRFFDFLSRAYRTVDACGSVRRNWAGPVPTRFDTPAYRSFLGQWRFVLCFENARGPWYVTEKVINAYLAGCIPVYWGCPPADLERLGFNLRAMVYVEDHDAARAAVAALDADPARARAVFEQPLLAHPGRLAVVVPDVQASTTTVAFWDDQLTERGTTTAVFDYAWHNRETLGHRSVVLFDRTSSAHHPAVVAKFRAAFSGPGEFVEVDGFAGVDAALARLVTSGSAGKVVLYTIRAGRREADRVSRLPGVRTAVHCVFSALAADRHGDVYAAISRSVDTDLPADQLPVVPHMVDLGPGAAGGAGGDGGRAAWRKAAGVPADAVVFGRHGGYTTFDIPWVHAAVVEVAQRCPRIFFAFVNTRAFGPPLPNVLFLPAVVDVAKKAEFIRGCDAMLWGRSDGETFGLAVAEFSALGRPVFARRTGPGECAYVRDPNAHVDILGDRGQLYTPATLAGMLEAFVPSDKMPDGRAWSAYDEYTPAKVMRKFAEAFLS
jgi:hypothetical protein